MLPTIPSPIRIALNRVTFGARDTDVTQATNMGWTAWVDDQLGAPPGDDSILATYLGQQTMPIKYNAPAANDTRGTWKAVNEDRPLNYIGAATDVLWNISRNVGSTFSSAELTRIRQELAAATWIRNAHSRYQLREFMTDFWHNHFNIGKNENELATSLLPVYDRVAIRPHALGNFRTMLEANASSTSMLLYLDNWVSQAATPKENYAREIMELHTLGGGAYLGTADPKTVQRDANGVSIGFTDQDIIQASRILSGWTVQYGQRSGTVTLGNTGEFFFNPSQHNTTAGTVLGVNIAPVSNNISQGRRFLDVIAYHPATAAFICTKLTKRIFGDTPPQGALDRAITAWKANQVMPDQIARTVRAIIVDGDEIMTSQSMTGPVAKIRRPYERIIALARTTDMAVKAATYMTSLLDPLNDSLFAWQAPNGRPDTNAYWLATGASVATWNILFQVPNFAEFSSKTLSDQSPVDAMNTPTGIVEYWVGRMVGYQLNAAAMNSLVADQAGANGVPAAVRTSTASRIETAHRRLVSLIATSEEFSLR